LRDDLGWATQDWPRLDDQRLQTFRDRVVRAFRDAYGVGSRQPDVRLLDWTDQCATARMIMASGPVLGLDMLTPAHQQLHVCRVFDCSAGQLRADRLEHRPSQAPLSEQMAKIPPGTYTLIDDDIASGFTVRSVQEMLPDGVRVREAVGLLRLGGEAAAADVVDLRDCLLGARHAGLVVEMPDGTTARAPYMLPYVSPVNRASLDPDRARGFSFALWEANIEFFAGSGLTVAESDSTCQPLLHLAGFAPTDSLEGVCAAHRDALVQLPYCTDQPIRAKTGA
jgi:hypothetical protein